MLKHVTFFILVNKFIDFTPHFALYLRYGAGVSALPQGAFLRGRVAPCIYPCTVSLICVSFAHAYARDALLPWFLAGPMVHKRTYPHTHTHLTSRTEGLERPAFFPSVLILQI